MAFFSKFSIKSIITGVATFVVLYGCLTFATTRMASSGQFSASALSYGGYTVWIISGFVAGRVSGAAGVLNGALVGAITPLVIALYLYSAFGGWEVVGAALSQGGLFWLVSGFILCGLGGLLSDVLQYISSTRSKD